MSSDGLSIEIYSDKDKWDTELIECIIPQAIENANREWNAINSIRWTSTQEWNTYRFVDRRRQQDEAGCVIVGGRTTTAQTLQTRPVATSGSVYSAVFGVFFGCFFIYPESNRDIDLKDGKIFREKAAKSADCAAALWRALDLKDTCSVCPRQRDDNSTNSSRSYLVSCTSGNAESCFSVGNPFDPFLIFKL